jgi:hypothetical protein
LNKASAILGSNYQIIVTLIIPTCFTLGVRDLVFAYYKLSENISSLDIENTPSNHRSESTDVLDTELNPKNMGECYDEGSQTVIGLVPKNKSTKKCGPHKKTIF